MFGLKCFASLLLFFSGIALAAESDLRDFARGVQFQSIKLSPNGDYLAATVPRDGETGLAILRLSDMKITAGVRGGLNTHVVNFWWANPERVLVSMGESDGPLDYP